MAAEHKDIEQPVVHFIKIMLLKTILRPPKSTGNKNGLVGTLV